MKEVILYSVQRALLLYNILLGPVHSVKKNLRKVRTGGGGEEEYEEGDESKRGKREVEGSGRGEGVGGTA